MLNNMTEIQWQDMEKEYYSRREKQGQHVHGAMSWLRLALTLPCH